MSRSTMVTLLILFPSMSILNALYFMRAIRKFIEETPRIDSRNDLDEFRGMVAKQMYAALVQIALLGVPLVLFVVGSLSRTLRPGDIWYVLVPNGIVIAVGKILRRFEKRAWRLPASDPELEEARDETVRTWERKALPDW